MVELRLDEKSGDLAQDLNSALEFVILPFQLFMFKPFLLAFSTEIICLAAY
ncbi:MAG: hypothetical protein Q4G66_02535 [bacterium]|nr:hypothetical protein [bacterium]